MSTLNGIFFHDWNHVARCRLCILIRKVRIGFLMIEIGQTLHTCGLEVNLFRHILRRVHFISRNQVDHTFSI